MTCSDCAVSRAGRSLLTAGVCSLRATSSAVGLLGDFQDDFIWPTCPHDKSRAQGLAALARLRVIELADLLQFFQGKLNRPLPAIRASHEVRNRWPAPPGQVGSLSNHH